MRIWWVEGPLILFESQIVKIKLNNADAEKVGKILVNFPGIKHWFNVFKLFRTHKF